MLSKDANLYFNNVQHVMSFVKRREKQNLARFMLTLKRTFTGNLPAFFNAAHILNLHVSF